jgi:4-amino-4-deoxy-L-arabinose transferase-like glycosyltransferase
VGRARRPLNKAGTLFSGLLLLAASVGLLFFDLGSRVFATNDETRFPLLARDILARGDWLLPHLNGRVYLNKPPLYAWLIVLASRPGGAVTQTTAALPSLLAAVGVVLLTVWIARRLFDPAAGLVAGLVTVTMYGVFTLARVPMPDIVLCLAFTGALAAFVAAELGGRRAALVAFYGLVALAFWTKGPAGLLPVAVVLAWALVATGRRGLARLVSVPGITLLGLLIAAWWWLGAVAGREAFTEGVVQGDMLRWYLPSRGPRWRALTEPIAQTATVLLPWVAVAPFAIWSALRSRGKGPERWRRAALLLAWAAVVFVAIGVSREQRMRYYLPLCPPVAILIGAWWAALPLRRRAAVFAAAWLVAAGSLVGWQISSGARHNAATDLSGVAAAFARAPGPLYAVETPELALAFYLDTPVVLLRGDRRLDEHLAQTRDGYLAVAERLLPGREGAAPARPAVAAGLIGGRRFSVFGPE